MSLIKSTTYMSHLQVNLDSGQCIVRPYITVVNCAIHLRHCATQRGSYRHFATPAQQKHQSVLGLGCWCTEKKPRNSGKSNKASFALA